MALEMVVGVSERQNTPSARTDALKQARGEKLRQALLKGASEAYRGEDQKSRPIANNLCAIRSPSLDPEPSGHTMTVMRTVANIAAVSVPNNRPSTLSFSAAMCFWTLIGSSVSVRTGRPRLCWAFPQKVVTGAQAPDPSI